MRLSASLRWIATPLILALFAGNDAHLRGDSAWFLPLDGTATAISDDGRTVVGYTSLCCNRWAAASWGLPSGEMLEVSTPPDRFYREAFAFDVSADGSVIVGGLWYRGHAASLRAPFVWTSDAGMQRLPKLSESVTDDGWASAVSGDGRTIVGGAYLGDTAYALEWRDGELRGTLPRGQDANSLSDISFDGSTIIGAANGIAALWDAERNLISLGILAGDARSEASNITPDGTRVVGNSWKGFGETYEARPFLWSRVDGLVELPVYPGSRWTSAQAISADGTLIVGSSGFNAAPPSEREAVIFGPNGHWRLLEDVLESVGMQSEIEGWDLVRAHSVSADGATIVGVGIDPDGIERSWVAHVPEGSTGVMLLIGVAFGMYAKWLASA